MRYRTLPLGIRSRDLVILTPQSQLYLPIFKNPYLNFCPGNSVYFDKLNFHFPEVVKKRPWQYM